MLYDKTTKVNFWHRFAAVDFFLYDYVVDSMENHPGIHTVTRAMEVSCSCREDVDADICDFFSSVIIELGNCEVKDATGGAAEAASMPKKPQTNKRVRFATFSSTMNYCKESPPVNLYYEDAVSSVITKIYKENPFFADDDDDLYSSEYAAAASSSSDDDSRPIKRSRPLLPDLEDIEFDEALLPFVEPGRTTGIQFSLSEILII